MKKLLLEYFYIFIFGVVLLCVALAVFPTKEDQLEFLEDKIERVQDEQKALTQKEKELQELATQKEWEEVDKNTNK